MSFQNWHVKHPSFTRDDPHFDLVYRQNVKPGKYHRVRQNTSSSPSSSASCATSSSLVESADGPSPVKLERPDESTFFPIDLPLPPPPLRFDPVYLEGHLTPLGPLGSLGVVLEPAFPESPLSNTPTWVAQSLPNGSDPEEFTSESSCLLPYINLQTETDWNAV